jgi:cytidyltransferase-like protein
MRICICTGHFNPGPHGGHLDYIKAAKSMSDKLWVIVNSDEQIRRRGDPILLSQDERLEIIGSIRYVDYGSIAIDEDGSVAGSIRMVAETIWRDYNPKAELIFCNGGDRTEANASSAESQVCQELGIREAWGVGGTNKRNSSSRMRNTILEFYGAKRHNE